MPWVTLVRCSCIFRELLIELFHRIRLHLNGPSDARSSVDCFYAPFPFFSKAYFTVDGEGAARYIKSTNSKNTNTPIIAVSAYSSTDPNETSNVFAAALAKPLQKADLIGRFSF